MGPLDCNEDCVRMPLSIVFDESCDSDCAKIVMDDAGIDKSNYNHLMALNIVILEDVQDKELLTLQMDYTRVKSIECDSCVTTGEHAPVCGTDGVTYSNSGEVDCANWCVDDPQDYVTVDYK